MDLYKIKLLELLKEDQTLRKDRLVSKEQVMEFDKHSTSELKSIVNQIGWPTISKVGEDASKAAWVLVQHTDDLSFARECLELMNINRCDIVSKYIALLTDKISVSEGKQQVYGTIVTTRKIDGEWVTQPKPIHEVELVDERRKAIGLSSLSSQLKRNHETFMRFLKDRR